jgi:RNA polymerase sigma factor (sigma-70 family)
MPHENPDKDSPDSAAGSGGSLQVLSRSFELLRRYQAGDERALEELLERYYPTVHQMARRRMKPAHRAIAGSMDVVQETFFTALRRLAEFDFRDPEALRRYLSAILENQLRNLWRRAQVAAGEARLDDIAPEGGRAALEPESREPQPFDRLSALEFLEIRAACAARLEERARTVLLLKEVAGAGWNDIAADCDFPTPHAAEQAYQRAKRERDLCVLRKIRF